MRRLGRAGRVEGRLVEEVGKTYRSTAAVLGITLLVTLAISGYVMGISHPRVVRLTEATKSVRTAHDAMLDQETGLRGYLITGDARFLGPYDAGREALNSANDGLLRDLQGDDTMVAIVLDVRVAQQKWIDYAENALPEAPILDRGRVREAFEEDKRLFDSYRSSQEDLISAILLQRDEALDHQRFALIAGTCIQVATIVIAVLIFQTRFRRLRPLVVKPLQRIVSVMERIRQGEPDARVEPSGVGELQDLAVGFNEMADAVNQQRQLAERQADQLVHRADNLHQILRLAREVSGNLNVRYVQETVIAASLAITGYENATIYLLDEERRQLIPTFDQHGPVRADAPTVMLSEGIVGQAASLGRRTWSAERIALPMVVGARVIGVLEFQGHRVESLSEEVLEVLETLGVHSATAIEAARLHETTEQLSRIDPLTLLPNRRRMDEELDLEVGRSTRYHRPLALIMCDIDHFKALNDEYGHPVGDQVLQEFARVLAGSLRTSDTAYRYGGEEFAILIREGVVEDASILAERLRTDVERRFSSGPLGYGVTASFGAASIEDTGPQIADLIASSDRALYAAKKGGRNQVWVLKGREIAPAPTVSNVRELRSTTESD